MNRGMYRKVSSSAITSQPSRTVVFLGPSKSLGTQKWETPVGKVIEGMDSVKKLYSGYGDGPPFGKGPAQGKIQSGRRYIEENFPLLDCFKTCKVERGVKPVAAIETKHSEKNQWEEPRRIRDEAQHETKHHKKPVETIPRLNDERKKLGVRRSDTVMHAFAAFAVIILVLLLFFGYRKSGRKGSKTS